MLREQERVWFFRPTLGQGGADRATLTVLEKLDRSRFAPSLVLSKKSGELLAQVPGDVPVHTLDAPNVGLAWLPLARLLQAEKPDVLFSTSSGTNVPAVLARQISGWRGTLILSERNRLAHTKMTPKRRAVIALKRALYGRADVLTAVSEGVKQDMVDTLGLSSGRIRVLYNPTVDDEMAEQAREPIDHPWFREDLPIVLGAGRLVAQKDFQLLLHAFAEVRKTRPARLVILGEGPLRGELTELARTLGIAAEVWMPGFDPNPFKYMARCSVFVLSSLHEGMPNVLIQAMASGAPAIATDCEFGPAEIIEHPGTDGILIRVGDAGALARELGGLLDDGPRRKCMGQAAQAAAERFKVAPAMEQIEAIL